MRKFITMLLAMPLMALGQTKTLVSVERVFPKIDKVLEFEKALAAHAQKFHKGDWQWRVYEIESGPDYGGYHITEGPTTWTASDTRGNLGTEHNNDWNKNVAIYLTDRGSALYAEYVDSLSTIAMGEYSDKIVLNHLYPKPGMVVNVIDLVKQMKKVWTAGNETVAVYSSVGSGAPEITTVTRLKQGLKEMEPGFRKPTPVRFNDVNGDGSWTKYLDDYAKYVERRWSELLFYRADLSSK
ncbi:MAG: hypothetical protein ACTHOF_10050 [Flavisolibacter sp.]|jgi:hypothetical protein